MHEILIYNLHWRSPEGLGANPKIDPSSDESDTSIANGVKSPLPNDRFDCEPLPLLFKDYDLGSIRKCLISVSQSSKSGKISYHFDKQVKPRLVLETPEEVPACFQYLLAAIPVPREIFFQSKEEGRVMCYSSRIPVLDEDLFGLKAFLFRTRLTISLPLHAPIENDEQTALLLGSWALSPYFRQSDSSLVSHVVPDSLCGKCMQGKKLYLNSDSLPPSWP